MRRFGAILLAVLICGGGNMSVAATGTELDQTQAERFARLALECVHREYPNKIAHVLAGDSDVAPPRRLTPAFYGCYDWHSAVHGHWLLARLARLYPDAPFAAPARAALARSLTVDNIKDEVVYLDGPGRVSFERPYGLAWLLQLTAELDEWDDEEARRWRDSLAPLESQAAARIRSWLPKLAYPIRGGEHSQTAFAFGLIRDWAVQTGDDDMLALLRERILHYYGNGRDCPLRWEPSGQDFLSPCLAEADLLRRVLDEAAFGAWLSGFLPGIPGDGSSWLAPAIVTDRSDPKLAHIDGLNLSRAWMLQGIAAGLPADDPRLRSLRSAAKEHTAAGLAGVTGEHYEGGHWLGTFATYLLTRRGQ